MCFSGGMAEGHQDGALRRQFPAGWLQHSGPAGPDHHTVSSYLQLTHLNWYFSLWRNIFTFHTSWPQDQGASFVAFSSDSCKKTKLLFEKLSTFIWMEESVLFFCSCLIFACVSGTCYTWEWLWPGIRGKSFLASRQWPFGTRALPLWPSSSPVSLPGRTHQHTCAAMY